MIPLALVVASGVVISYPWASNLAYRVMGEEPPASAARVEGRGGVGGREGVGNGAPIPFAAAERQVAGWRAITLRVPADEKAPLVYTIDTGWAGEPHKRGTLTVDRATGAVVKWETFAASSPGRKLRTILRFAHTGEVLGLPGQTIAGIASAGAVVLVYTGIALSLRRLAAWRRRRSAEPARAA